VFLRNIALLFLLTVFAVASVGLFRLLGDSKSFSGPKPNPAAWSNEEDAVIVTWYIDNTVGGGDKYEELIYAILEDERGWQNAGIDFQQVDGAYEADIVVRIYDYISENPCGNDDEDKEETLRACASIGLYSRDRTVYLPAISASDVFTFFVNHEFGHRLGFFHRGSGLMSPSVESNKNGKVLDGIIWPTDAESRLLPEILKRKKNNF